jgi:hypothetical protein
MDYITMSKNPFIFAYIIFSFDMPPPSYALSEIQFLLIFQIIYYSRLFHKSNNLEHDKRIDMKRDGFGEKINKSDGV